MQTNKYSRGEKTSADNEFGFAYQCSAYQIIKDYIVHEACIFRNNSRTNPLDASFCLSQPAKLVGVLGIICV